MGDLFRHALTQGLKELDLTVHEEKIEKLTMYKIYFVLERHESDGNFGTGGSCH